MTSSIPLRFLSAQRLTRGKNSGESSKKHAERLTIFNNVPTLDGWRALAVIGVVLYHWASLNLSPNSLWCHLASRGRFGVDVFFAISGFLICGRLVQDLHNDGTISLKHFYIKRAFRILPPIGLYLTALAALMLLGWTQTQGWEFISTLLFVRNYFPLYHHLALGRYTAQFWSLAVEEHFYLIWPFVLLLLRKRLRTAVAVTMSAAVAIFIWRTLDATHGWFTPFGTDVNAKTDTRFDALLWGCLAAFAYSYLQRHVAGSRVYRSAWKVVVPLALLFTVFQNIPGASLFRAVIFPALIVSTALSPASSLSQFLSVPSIRWIGRLSYSIYIWQQLALFPTLVSDSPLRMVQQFPFDLVAIVATATISYYLVERPMIRIGHHLAEQRPFNASGQADPSVVVAPATSFAQ